MKNKVKFNDKNNEILSLSPYTSTKRYEKPKQVFIFALQEIERFFRSKKTLTLVDIGCANGEYLYYVKKNHPQWQLFGYDFMPEFIQTAKQYPGLQGVYLETMNFFNLKKKFDIVCCFGTFPIFPDIKKPLKKLLNLCKNDGLLVVDGLFNKFDIDVVNSYRDNSRPESKNIWRVDFNQHSQKTVSDFLRGKVREVEFKKIPFNVDIPYGPQNPHANVFTIKDAKGKRLLTNGMNLLLNPTLLLIHK